MSTKSKPKPQPRKVLNLDIVYDDLESLLVEAEKDTLKGIIGDELMLGIEEALDKKLDKAHLCNIPNFKLKVEISKKDFKKSLAFIKAPYLNKEDYEKCTKIQSLIDRI